MVWLYCHPRNQVFELPPPYIKRKGHFDLNMIQRKYFLFEIKRGKEYFS